MFKIKLYLFSLILFLSSTFAQDISEYYKKVEDKLKYDKSYLNVYTVQMNISQNEINSFRNIPRLDYEPYNFLLKEGVTYEIYFLKDNPDIDSMVLLQVTKIEDKSISGEQASLFGAASGNLLIDTSIVVHFRDFIEMYYENKDYYNLFFNYTKRLLNEIQGNKTLRIPIDERIDKTSGVTVQNNEDFLKYMWANSFHEYPKPPDQSQSIRSIRGGGVVEKPEFQVDFSLGRVSFFHEVMDFDFSKISVEFNTLPKLMNFMPFQSMSLTASLRTLILVSQDIKNIEDDIIIDAKIGGRFKLNTSSFSSSIPNIFIDPPRLNFATGVEVEVNTTRIIGLPFLNFYISAGAEDYSDPFVKFVKNDIEYAYFSPVQWYSTMSFFWSANEKRTLKFKFDIGVGSYFINKATYLNSEVFVESIKADFLPILNLDMSFLPTTSSGVNELLMLSIKYFDNQISAGFWLKLLEFNEGEHLVRFETNFISSPINRSLSEWEVEGGGMIGFRYRYGFK